MSNESFGSVVRAARLRSGLTGQQFAARIGVQQSTLSRYENGQNKEAPPPAVVAAISGEFGVPEIDLVRGMGYLGASPACAADGESTATRAFRPGSSAARVVEIMQTLTEEEVGFVLATAEFVASHRPPPGSAASGGHGPNRRAG